MVMMKIDLMIKIEDDDDDNSEDDNEDDEKLIAQIKVYFFCFIFWNWRKILFVNYLPDAILRL